MDIEAEPFSEIEVEFWDTVAILRNPLPVGAGIFSFWICHDPGVKVVLDMATYHCIREGLCPDSPRGLPNWAVDVGRVVAKRLGAKIIREKTFNMEEYLRTHPPLEDDPMELA